MRKKSRTPVLNLVELASQWAVKMTRNKTVGVIGTANTAQSRVYSKTIMAINPSVVTYEKACLSLVDKVEEGVFMGREVQADVEKALIGLTNKPIDTLILGCTHYSLLARVFGQCLSPSITILDPAVFVASNLKMILEKHNLLNDKGGKCEFFFTSKKQNAERIARDNGIKVNSVNKVKL
jgi:glutamate racemase